MICAAHLFTYLFTSDIIGDKKKDKVISSKSYLLEIRGKGL